MNLHNEAYRNNGSLRVLISSALSNANIKGGRIIYRPGGRFPPSRHLGQKHCRKTPHRLLQEAPLLTCCGASPQGTFQHSVNTFSCPRITPAAFQTILSKVYPICAPKSPIAISYCRYRLVSHGGFT